MRAAHREGGCDDDDIDVEATFVDGPHSIRG